ncbi:extracellular solute-binding protein [Candidatus Actinomarina sp.]|jgi:alpha-glucoside transport system substrate-binding protein|nr:extracellular solute-binding protein [Candidatus Actinomarina sp.]
MGLKKNIRFISVFLVTTVSLSIIAYQPSDVIIGGPTFPQLDYFIEELEVISNDLGIEISYETHSDIETYLIQNPNNNLDLAIIPNPQGVVNLGQRDIALPITTFLEDEFIEASFSQHLQNITTSKIDNNNYGAWFRLIPNSLIWYDVQKYNDIGSPTFNTYEEMIKFTSENSFEERPLWCMDIESGASTGWIATNWLEDIILHEYGPSVYDEWYQQEKLSSSEEITLSILEIGKLIFIDDAIYGGNKRMVRKEFRNNYRNLLSDENTCTFSWSGHFASYYFPQDANYGTDYDFFKFPSAKNKNAMVGIGDVIIGLNSNKKTSSVMNILVSGEFGKTWMSKEDSQYIAANIDSNVDTLINPMTIKETNLIKASLSEDLFRYDASELMERKIGADSLWYALMKYIELKSLYIEEVTEELDSSY